MFKVIGVLLSVLVLRVDAETITCQVGAERGVKALTLNAVREDRGDFVVYHYNSGSQSAEYPCRKHINVFEGVKATTLTCIGPQRLTDNDVYTSISVQQKLSEPSAQSVKIQFYYLGRHGLEDFGSGGPVGACQLTP